VQRELLDYFGGLVDQRQATGASFVAWQSLQQRLDDLQTADADRESRLDLLEFQIGELDALDVGQDELPKLQAEREKLKNSGKLADGVSAALAKLSADDAANASTLLAEALRAVESLLAYDGELEPVRELLESATIQIAEATETLQRYGDAIDMDPVRRDWVEERLDAMQSVARKHRVAAENLQSLAEELRAEYDDLTHAEERGKELEEQVADASTAFRKLAETLSKARKKAAKAFSAAVTGAMSGLGMPGGVFTVNVTALPNDAPRPWGTDDIEFLISANPGQPPMPLSRVASGGELSRMSLAIQVIASDGSSIPTMVFDEVDSGVGGRVAEMVGRRLRELGATRQVLCVTHLPQVASLANQHFRISKVSDGKETQTALAILSKEERVEELARMLGGVDITKKTKDHAAEMLAGAERKRA
jgi:DNA repair protein RecN (Recombination protein N)